MVKRKEIVGEYFVTKTVEKKSSNNLDLSIEPILYNNNDDLGNFSASNAGPLSREVDWEVLVANSQTIDDAVSKLTQVFALILKNAPTLKRHVSDRYTPWLNVDYFKLAKARDKFKIQLKHNSNILIECYKQIRSRLNNLKLQKPFAGTTPYGCDA